MPESLDDGSTTVRLTALGVPVAIHAHGDGAVELAGSVRRSWAWCLAGTAPGDDLEEIRLDVVLDSRPAVVADARGRGAVAGSDVDTVLHDLSPAVTLRAITEQQTRLLMFHACGLADPRTGDAVALVAASGVGKTTAALRLGRELAYLSDETVALRDDGTVVPYPKPLSILGRDTHVKAQVSPGDLGLRRPPAQCRLRAVALLERDAGGPAEPVVTPVDTVRALAALSPQISSLGLRPRPLQRLAGVLEDTGGLARVTYRDAVDLLPVVETLLEGRR